jgi:hypothetical protein
MNESDVGADIQVVAAKERSYEKREAVLSAGREGKSVVQAIQAKVNMNAPSSPFVEKDGTDTLLKEKRRIERTIESLTRRLEELKQQIISRKET